MSLPSLEEANQDFLDNLEYLHSFDEIADCFESIVRKLGLDGYCFWTYRRKTLDDLIMERCAPEVVYIFKGPVFLKPLEALYFRSGCHREDPTTKAAEQSRQPFSTMDILSETGMSKKVRVMWKLFNRYGFTQDVFLPFHTGSRIQILYLYKLNGKGPDLENPQTIERFKDLASNFVLSLSDYINLDRFVSVNEVLTTREQECLTLISRGYSNSQMAEELGLSERTVKFHVSNMMDRFQAGTRAEAIAKAARSNWLMN